MALSRAGLTTEATLLSAYSSGYDSNSSLYRCWWHIPFDAAGRTFTAKTTVTFKSTAISNPSYSQVVKETASVLVFPNGASRASPLQAGKQFVVNLSARLKNPDGSFQSINWHRSGSSATCKAHIVGGATLSGTVKRFTTGVQCLWSIPYSARGQQIAFSITVKANGLTKTINFTGRPA